MNYLPIRNQRHTQYNDIMKQLKLDDKSSYLCNKSGKLIICLIEFRLLHEIEHVISAVTKIYNDGEVGIAIMHGNINKSYIESKFKKFENIVLIHKDIDNVDRGVYSGLLKQPEFYEYFKDWSHVLIYQTDSLLFRKIDDIYFNYDYIGSPWVNTNQWCKYNAGNGGFSLRNVSSCIQVCESNRNVPVKNIHRGNEDGFFCSQSSFKYPMINSILHRAFAVERVNFPMPIGVHQIYHNFNMNTKQWDDFIEYMRICLIEKQPPYIDIKNLCEQSKRDTEEEEKRQALIEELDLSKLEEITNKEYNVGPFKAKLKHIGKNQWIVNCENKYEVLFCANNNPESVIMTHEVEQNQESCIHKKASGCYYMEKGDNTYIVFYPGFPNGGECWADINTGNGHYGHCNAVPKNGAIILKSNTLVKNKEQPQKQIQEINNSNEVVETNQMTSISELHSQEQIIGPFTTALMHVGKNQWITKCDNDYEILFCRNTNPRSVICSHKVNRRNESCLHKKAAGCHYLVENDYIYLIFYPGFPNGGECWADINAGNGNYAHCREVPKNGAIILKAPLQTVFVPPIDTKQYNIENIDANILAFDLFTGVGFYNQLFSLEQAIYMASVSNRYLILNIRHPLVACGCPHKDFGIITDYITDHYKEFLVGFEIRKYRNFVDPVEHELTTTAKMSSCVFVDVEDGAIIDENDLKDFAHHRNIIWSKHLKELYDPSVKIVYFRKSNASRVFMNFYTTQSKYDLMNHIAYSLSSYNGVLTEICHNLLSTIENEFISIHLRMGDKHKNINSKENEEIINNINNWLSVNNKRSLSVYIMTDKPENPLFARLNNWNVVFIENFINEDIKKTLKNVYKKTDVAEFLIQKFILEQATIFIGSQGSTVSTHAHYNCFLNNKAYEYITTSNCRTFDKGELKLKDSNDSKYSWKRKGFIGGHVACWAMFFENNVYKPPTKYEKKVILNKQDKNVKLEIKEINKNEFVKDSTPHMSVDFWLLHSDIVIDKKGLNIEFLKQNVTKDAPLIFLKTDLIGTYVEQLNHIEWHYRMVTASNDDHCPPYLEFPTANNELKSKVHVLLDNPNLLVWYAKNPAILHDKLHPYILGPKWQWKTTRFFGENKYDHKAIFDKYIRNITGKLEEKKNLLYFNFNQTTNNPMYKHHKNIRHKAKSDILKNGFKWNDSEQFEEYIHTLSQHRFCISPPGRGIDTHRCWEALIVGCIPIVISSSLNELYKDLPVVIVDSYEIVTEDFLHKQYCNLSKQSFNYEKLSSQYWLKQISEECLNIIL